MKFVLASYGSRGDIEPCAAVGRELLRRGHEVRMAVPPDLVSFVEGAGLAPVAYGLDTRAWMEAHRDLWTRFSRNFWKIPDLIRLAREVREPINECWMEISTTLKSLADGADLLFTGLSFEQPAANVAEYYDIPLATLHYHPARANGQLMPVLPAPVGRAVMRADEWLGWRVSKKVEDTQRGELGLPETTSRASLRMSQRGSLEIQAYDEACFPGLATEWAKWGDRRPFVGALTLELATDADDDVAAWIAAGTPPIFFGFGSNPIESVADTLAMIGGACAQLGERALVCAGWSDFSGVPHYEHVKVVGALNFAAIFPACRAVVHHGGTGTTAAGLRAGVPTVVLWTWPGQSLWGRAVERLKLGTSRRFTSTTEQSLVADLRTVLSPDYIARAHEFAPRMTAPAESVAAAADLLEEAVRLRQVAD
ncbi:glycosyltransferase [Mycolicibacterium tusciae]|uniref:Glycosyl transferase family 1 n=1 Tax=Mycolicibacterium tusciae TaxID=75922 RepID=A0A1X0JDY9_9MYCO|nr:glycosyltransferase [Mycolicibacterium tusciae]ORB61068.1 glycosyl transferase family 1 [Mycolicibacterium tusciae]